MLPKMLYLFRTIPIPLPKKLFQKFEIYFRKCIWKGGRARIPFNTLIKHKSVGGVGLPILKHYQTAAILDTLKYWFTPNTDKLWVSNKKILH